MKPSFSQLVREVELERELQRSPTVGDQSSYGGNWNINIPDTEGRGRRGAVKPSQNEVETTVVPIETTAVIGAVQN